MPDGNSNQEISAGKQITRRDFLKGVGMVIAGTTLAVATGCNNKDRKESVVSIDFREVKNGERMNLEVGEKGQQEILIQYTPSREPKGLDPLFIRQENKKDAFSSFKEGNETTRLPGEIIEGKLYRVEGKNPELPKDTTVGVYPKLTGNMERDSDLVRKDLSELFGFELYALPVIVTGAAAANYHIDGLPLENKKNGKGETFAEGAVVGILTVQGEAKQFRPEGVVCDLRALNLK